MSSEEANRIAKAAASVRRRSRASLKVMLPTAAALGAGTAVAIGAIPGSDGTITGCYNTVPLGASTGPTGGTNTIPYGALRVIDPSQSNADVGADVSSCMSNEQTITWNQHGPPGQQGATGARGATGPQGAEGAAGAILGDTTFSIQSTGNTKLYLKLDGVAGPLTAKEHKSQIALKLFAAGAEKPIGSQSTGAGAGKVQVQTFEFVKTVDKASPTLFKDLSTGHVIKTASVDVFSASHKQAAEVGTYKLTDLVIKNISDKGKTEQVTGVFKSLQSTIGSGQDKVNTGWNKVQNSSWDLTSTKSP